MPPFTPFIEMQAKQPSPLPEQKEILYVLFSVCFLGPQVSVAKTCTPGAALITMAMMAPLSRVHPLVSPHLVPQTWGGRGGFQAADSTADFRQMFSDVFSNTDIHRCLLHNELLSREANYNNNRMMIIISCSLDSCNLSMKMLCRKRGWNYISSFVGIFSN